MNIFSLFTLIGGLAFFLYGMNVMSSGLEKMTGGKLESALKRVTTTPLKSLLFGAGVTIAIQSSSAMTVMLVGFVNSGIMELRQTIGIIMGSNIGTTLTAWILSLAGVKGENIFIQLLQPERFSPIIAMIGILLLMIGKKKKKDIGNILIGFSILMFGMQLMSEAVKPLADMPQFTKILVAFKNPILGVLVGAAFTGIIQSSAASVGILQAFSLTGSVTFGMAMPIIMGQNIGTCVTALLSSIGVNKNAKRVAMVHIYFNLIGTIICLSLFYTLHFFLRFSFVEDAISPVGIAGVHSIFNLMTTTMLFPFMKQLERLAKKTIPESRHKEPTFLDQRLLATPSFAIAECHEQILKMARLTKTSVAMARDLHYEYSDQMMKEVKENEEQLDYYEDNLGTYLLKLGKVSLSDKDNREVSRILHVISDFERIGDHALNLAEVAEELHEKKLTFSEPARDEADKLLDAVMEILDMAIESYCKNDKKEAVKVEPLEEVIDMMCDNLKETHIKRLRKGICTPEQGFIFNDLITNCERIADHCSNVAVCIIRVGESSFDTHKFLHDMKTKNDPVFEGYYVMFYKKYIV
ncbi:MAG: Na/Pi cotransporter family protein [bacterium]|nr:Na/Pi cotransporter family protein [bacterium]